VARETFSIEGLAEVKARLEALPRELVSKGGGPVRVGLRKGALVIRDKMRQNAQEVIDRPNVGGGDESTGLLVKSITVKRGKAHASLKGERYWVMIPKRLRYPISTRSPSGISVERVGQMLEYGTSRVPAYPWAGPAFHATKGEAVAVVVREMGRGLSRVEKQLQRIKR
jgi:HK97 gp10 family phage protein